MDRQRGGRWSERRWLDRKEQWRKDGTTATAAAAATTFAATAAALVGTRRTVTLCQRPENRWFEAQPELGHRPGMRMVSAGRRSVVSATTAAAAAAAASAATVATTEPCDQHSDNGCRVVFVVFHVVVIVVVLFFLGAGRIARSQRDHYTRA